MNKPENKVNEVFPYLRVKDAPAAIAFYQQVFGAKEQFRLTEPSGRIGHVQLELGNIVLMLSGEFPEYGMLAPQASSAGVLIHLHVENADEMSARAIAAGATMVHGLSDEFYGERNCTIRDPFGHEWMLGHEIEPISPEEMQRRYIAMFK
jgi:PhnB protein